MLALTVLALGTVTAGVGSLFETHAASADTQRVATQFAETLDSDRTTGPRTGRVSFSDGHLSTEPRELRILDAGSVVETVDVDALVFERGDSHVEYVAGAIVRNRQQSSWLDRPPAITSSSDPAVLVIGAPRVNASHTTVGTSGSTTIRTNVSHDRTDLGQGTFSVAIETETPDAFDRYFEGENATTTERDFDGDGIDSVVGEYSGTRTGYLVVHDLRVEVGNG